MIDAMTLSEVEIIFEGWRDHPPVHILLAAFLGLGRDKQGPITVMPPQEMLAGLGPGFRGGDIHSGLGTVVLDIAQLRYRSQAARLHENRL